MRKAGYVDSLINNQVVRQPRVWMDIFQYRQHSQVALGPKGMVIPLDVHRPVKVKNNQCIPAYHTGVGMGVKLQSGFNVSQVIRFMFHYI